MRPDSKLRFIALILWLCFIALPVRAGDADNGEILANRWCGNCHQVGSRMPAQDAVPPLSEVASRPYADRKWLTGWLTDPHPPMPKLDLTRREIDDLVSYLVTLRRPR
jgi:mono/diheme cytochrome c family protein